MHRFYRTHTMHMTYMICQPYLGQEAWEGRWGAVDREWLDKTGIVSFMLGPLPPHSLQSFLPRQNTMQLTVFAGFKLRPLSDVSFWTSCRKVGFRKEDATLLLARAPPAVGWGRRIIVYYIGYLLSCIFLFIYVYIYLYTHLLFNTWFLNDSSNLYFIVYDLSIVGWSIIGSIHWIYLFAVFVYLW